MKPASLVVTLILFGAASCKDDTKPVVAKLAAAEAPIAAPEGLLADVVVTSPNAIWSKLQRGIGGAVGILPATLGGLVCTLSGIDPGLGPEIDGASPAFGALAGDMSDPAFVLAVKLVDPRHARIVLVDGDTARFGARDADGMTELVPKGTSAPVSVALANGGWLLVARTLADLRRIGPYVYRTLPTRPLRQAQISVLAHHAALAGAIRTQLGASWGAFKADKLEEDAKLRRDHGGRAPDFGDPQAIIGTTDSLVQRKLDVLGDLAELEASIDVADEDVRAAISLVPASNPSGPAAQMIEAMRPGDASPLLAAPLEAPLTLLFRDDVALRTSDAADVEGALAGMLGKRLGPADAKKLHDVLDGWAKGRGDVMTLSTSLDKPRGVMLRANGGENAARAVHDGLDLLRTPAIGELLRVREISFSTADAPGVGKASLAMLTTGAVTHPEHDDAKPKGPKPAPLGVAWIAPGPELDVGAGDDPLGLLVAAMKPARALAQDRLVAGAVGAFADTASFVLVAQPLRLDPKRADSPAAPFVLGWGKSGHEAWVKLHVADLLLREIARKQIGL